MPPNSWPSGITLHLKKSWESLSSWLNVSTLAMIKFCRVFTARKNNVQCPLLPELQRLWLSHSQAGMPNWAGVRTRGLDVLQCTSNLALGHENAAKYAFRDPKIKNIFWGGSTGPSSNGQGDTPPVPHPHTIGAILAPSALDLAPKSKSWIRPCRDHADVQR